MSFIVPLSVFVALLLTWEQDAGGDALQDSAQGFSWTERADSTADHLLHQQLQSLHTHKTPKGKQQSQVTLWLSQNSNILIPPQREVEVAD